MPENYWKGYEDGYWGREWKNGQDEDYDSGYADGELELQYVDV